MDWGGDRGDRGFLDVGGGSGSVCGWIGVVTGLMGEFPMWERIRVQCVGGLGGDRRDKGISRCGR